MSYKDKLKKQIEELELKISTYKGERLELVQELNRLRLMELEEDLSQENKQILLKG